MKILIPTLFRGVLIALLLCPLQSDAGFLDFLRGEKKAQTSELDTQEIAARAMLKNARDRELDGKDESAREIHESLVEQYPLTTVAADSQFKVGELYELEGKDSKAFDAYDEFITKYKESALFEKGIERQFDIAQRGYKGKTDSFLGVSRRMQPSRLIEMFTAITKNAPYTKYAPHSQYSIGEIHAEQGKVAEAISAYQKVVADYPDDKKASEAQFRIGELLTDASQKGNNDQAHLRKTREAYEEFLIQFPKDELAAAAMDQLDEIEAQEISKTFEIAQFYEKSGNFKAAAIYYKDVLKHPSASEFEQARERMDVIGEKGDLRIGDLDLAPKVTAVPAKYDVKSRSDYLGPPAPKLASTSNRRSMRGSMDDFKPVPIVEPDLPEAAPVMEDSPSPISPIQSLLPPVTEAPAPAAAPPATTASPVVSPSPTPFETLLPPPPSLLGTPSSPTLTIDGFSNPSPAAGEKTAPEEIKIIKSTED